MLNKLGTQYLLALLGLAMFGIGLHLEMRFTQEAQRVDGLQNSIQLLVKTQIDFLDRTGRPIVLSGFGEGFRRQALVGSRIGTLRVFAISSQQILSFMRFENFQVDKCMLLLRGFGTEDSTHSEFANQIILAARDWHRMAAEGKINNLIIRSYDFHPTEYQVIFDDRGMLTGLYDSDPTDYSEVKVRSPLYVDGSTGDGRTVIGEYQQRFDQLFQVCALHHGKNSYDQYCYTRPEGAK
jgi:hypothetical protein